MRRASVNRSPEVTALNVRTTFALGACAAQTLFVKPGLVADLHIVAVGIEHIGSVIAGIELRPQPWRAIILAAIGKRCFEGLVHRRLVLRGERDVKLGACGL